MTEPIPEAPPALVSTHLPDKGIACARFTATQDCPLAVCPYAHIVAGSRRRLPTMLCHYYNNARCLRDSCNFFHGPRKILEQLKTRGDEDYCPLDYMAKRDPLKALTPLEASTPASKLALQLFGLSRESSRSGTLPSAAASNPPQAQDPSPPPYAPAAPMGTMAWMPQMMVAPQQPMMMMGTGVPMALPPQPYAPFMVLMPAPFDGDPQRWTHQTDQMGTRVNREPPS